MSEKPKRGETSRPAWLLPFVLGVIITVIAGGLVFLLLTPAAPNTPSLPLEAQLAQTWMTRAGNERLPGDIPIMVLGDAPGGGVRVQTLNGGIEAVLRVEDIYTQTENPTSTPIPDTIFWTVGSTLFTLEPLGEIPIYSRVTVVEIRDQADGRVYLIQISSGTQAEARADQLTDR